jgi:hypothetical protein
MRSQDYIIIKRDDTFVYVLRDEFTTGVYTCDKDGRIISPGNRLLVTHLSYEENFVKFRHVVGKMTNTFESSIGDNGERDIYFGAIGPRICHEMEVIDSLKVYDKTNETEYIYVRDEDYERVDGSHMEHMKICRERFKNLVEAFQEWVIVTDSINTIVDPKPRQSFFTTKDPFEDIDNEKLLKEILGGGFKFTEENK